MPLPHQIADGTAPVTIRHHASGTSVNTQLVLDGYTAHIVALTQAAVGLDQELRYCKQRNALHTRWSAVDAGKYQMHDVGREIVLTIGDEDLLPADAIVPALGRSACTDCTQVRTR